MVDDAVNTKTKLTVIRQQELVQQTAVERFKRLREAALLGQRLRVVAAESGTSTESLAALDRQISFDSQIDVNLLNRQLKSNLRINRIQAQLQIGQLAAQGIDPHLASIGGAAQGASTGLAIQNQVQANQAATAATAAGSTATSSFSSPATTGSFSGTPANGIGLNF